MGRVRRLAATLTVFAVVAVRTSAAAEPTAGDRETTRALLAEGDRLVAEKDFEAALRAFSGAAAIITVPTTVIEVGRMQEALGQLVEARDSYLKAARIAPAPGEPAPFAVAREEATALAAGLAERIPSVAVSIGALDPGVQPIVTIDGARLPSEAALLPRKLNPGSHSVVVNAAGYMEAMRTIDLHEGETRTVEISLEATSHVMAAPVPKPAAAPHSERRTSPLMVAGFGVGAAGFAVGSVFGIMSLSRASDADEFCHANGHCTSQARRDASAATDLANVSNVGFAVALVGAGVGLYAFLTRPKSPPTAFVISPFGARGTF